MAHEKIVIIEDEPDIREVIEYNLKKEGYVVHAAPDGEGGLILVRRELPEIVLLDLMLPGLDGREVCRRLKQDDATRTIPIIMVTARGEESDVVLGLGLGADDYVVKPFSPRELVARVQAVLRRGPPKDVADASVRLVRGGLVIDPTRHEVLSGGERIELTATEFRLLAVLAKKPGRVYTRNELLNRVKGEPSYLIDRNIDVHIRAVRKKLGAHRDLIETVRGVGYRFSDRD